ncbi:MAG: hypothetical protein JNK77_15890 [Saprospiraceae bacterium]|nr:hypothetical protein [Saprospiraceae bacterium]
MKVKLIFDGLDRELKEAQVTIRIEDQSQADAPAPLLLKKQVGPFNIHPTKPNLMVEFEAEVQGPSIASSIIVRVSGKDRTNRPLVFLNTTSKLVDFASDRIEDVHLSQITK